MRPRAKKYGKVMAAFAAGGLLLTGCTAGGTAGGAAGGGAGGGARYDGKSRSGPVHGAPDGGVRRSGPPTDYRSTFALDVDTASYGFARRTIGSGRLPDPNTVRPEEFVNSFRQDYRQPGGNGFSVAVDGARTSDDGWSLMRVGLTTKAPATEAARKPAALTFVVDISGSMAEPGRLDLVRSSLELMTDRLRDDDSIAVVTFSDQAETRIPMTRLGGRRERVHEVISGLLPTDSTNVEAGVTRGYEVAVKGLREDATNRVVVLSDGLANSGDTSADGILERVATAREDKGITLFGVGVGSDYGDTLMETLADRGDGHTTYVSDLDQARRVFCDDLPAQIDLRARDAKAQVAFDPRTVESFRLIGYEDRRVADDDFRDDAVDGGEVGPGHSVTALYAVRTRPGAAGHVATATVRWLDPATRAPHEESASVEAAALTGRVWGEADARFQLTAVAAYFASALRERGGGWEPVPGALPLDRLAERASAVAAMTQDADVRGLADTIRQASRLRS
ncbi:von Willebrand factor type A domain-containing protein [Streptomyces sp. G-G2]|uniref:vWA domain-containing protein n=1 Tax=Streptomyces sp. G-G2 TaxID=3046201 RepID=UPI0024BBABC0|nr:von Willebrand factor type A domain-containing protein [Streptomyces sp. G-G2]MDJ0379992.1 von Willebrand factor type A domain-containing protein [Streptomyces sp. G-G2]